MNGTPNPPLDFNLIVDYVRAWLMAEYPPEQTMSGGWEITLTDEVGNEWLAIDGRPQMPYEKGSLPGEVSFAVWRATGAIHRLRNGEAQEPPIGMARVP